MKAGAIVLTLSVVTLSVAACKDRGSFLTPVTNPASEPVTASNYKEAGMTKEEYDQYCAGVQKMIYEGRKEVKRLEESGK